MDCRVHGFAKSRTPLGDFHFLYQINIILKTSDRITNANVGTFWCNLFNFQVSYWVPLSAKYEDSLWGECKRYCGRRLPSTGETTKTRESKFSRNYIHPKKKVKSLSRIRSFATPMDCSLPGSSIHGIFQIRALLWAAISFSRASSQLRDQTRVSRIAGRLFAVWATKPYSPKEPVNKHKVHKLTLRFSL